MYEVNLRAFSAAGTLDGVTSRLDALQAMGVNVLWLMPIHPIGEIRSVNSPYSVKDYLAVSPAYGNLNDLRELTDAAHQRGMAVIMDWVANHTAWDNPWIANRSWYTQNAAGEITMPAGTNWADVADLNFSNSAMREAMINAMKYWVLEANVDGYRCDYADGVPFDFWQEALDTLHQLPDREYVLLAEGSRLDHWTAGFDLIFGWDFYGALKNVFAGQNANILFSIHQSEYAGAPSGKHRLRYSTNHDQSAWEATPIALYGGTGGATAASVITAFVGGVPMIYTAQEIGRAATLPFFSRTVINWNDNPEMQQAYRDFMSFYAGSAVAQKGNNLNYSSANVVSFTKTLGNEELLILVNVRNTTTTYALPAALSNTNWTNALTEAAASLEAGISLTPYQYFILKRVI